MIKGDLEARMIAMLKLLSRTRDISEEILTKRFAEEQYDFSAESERDEGKILIDLEIEAREYLHKFVELGFVKKDYQDRPGMSGHKDIMYKLTKDHIEAKKILNDYISSQTITNYTINITKNANNNNNT